MIGIIIGIILLIIGLFFCNVGLYVVKHAKIDGFSLITIFGLSFIFIIVGSMLLTGGR